MFSNLIGQLIVSTENDQWSMLNLQDLWSPKIVRLRTLFGQTDGGEGLSPTCDALQCLETEIKTCTTGCCAKK